jgi:DNA repair exonuclease SbcCD nuclease subunit
VKFILLSDIHLVADNPIGRLDNIVEDQWRKLGFVFGYASRHGITHILQAGDLVDRPRSWELLSKLSSFLNEWKENLVTMCVVRGQHDSYYHNVSNDKTISGVLVNSSLVTLLGDRPFKVDVDVHVYGVSYGDDVPKVTSKKHMNILVIHQQIVSEKLWDNQTDFTYALDFLRGHMDYDLILCGDAHQTFIKASKGHFICNTGPMLRLEASKQMFDHHPQFMVYDTETGQLESVVIPHSPADQVLTRDHLNRKKDRQDNFDLFISQVNDSDYSKSFSFETILEKVMKSSGASNMVRGIVSEYLAKTEE